MSKLRKTKCKCGSEVFDYEENDKTGKPEWECQNCFARTPRQVRKSAKQKRIDKMFANMFESKEKKGKSAVRKTFDLKPKKPKKPKDDPTVKLNKEDTEDDILGLLGYTKDSFDKMAKSAEKHQKFMDKLNANVKKQPRVKTYKARKIRGKKVKGFADYLRTESEVKKVMKEKLGTSKITLDNVIKLFGDFKIKLDERVVLDYDIKEIDKYKEYDRTRQGGGKNTPEEWDELEASIRKKGIKQHGILNIDRDNNSGSMEVILGEGNHRLAIAKMAKIKKMPLRISYYP